MSDLLFKVKENLIVEHSADDELITRLISAAVDYAERYQHLEEGYYSQEGNTMPRTTEQGIIICALANCAHNLLREDLSIETAGFNILDGKNLKPFAVIVDDMVSRNTDVRDAADPEEIGSIGEGGEVSPSD